MLKETDYTKDSWTALQEALDEAKIVLDNANAMQEEVENAKTLLQTAKEELVKAEEVTVNKTALSIAVEMAGNVTELDKVVPVVVTEFKVALQEAQTILADESVSQEEVDASFARLSVAMHMLQFYKGERSELQGLIVEAEGLDGSRYTDKTWNDLIPVLQEAQEVLANESASQEEVDNAYNALVKAYLELRLIPDKSLLQELIDKAQSLDGANYSAKTWNVAVEALDKAKEVLIDPEATQEEVDNAKDVLIKAIAGLEVNSNNQVNSGDAISSVKTGDTINLMHAFVGLIVTSIVLFENKKRRANG